MADRIGGAAMKPEPPRTDTAIPLIQEKAHKPFHARLTDAEGNAIWKTDLAEEAGLKIKDLLETETAENRRQILNGVKFKLGIHSLPDFSKVRAELVQTKTADNDAFARAIIADVMPLIKNPKLERLTESRAHALQEAVNAQHVIVFDVDKGHALRQDAQIKVSRPTPKTADANGLDNLGHSFVVEHDWAGAFANSEEFAAPGAIWHLPFDITCFEFKVSGHHLCAVARTVDGDVMAVHLMVEAKHIWLNADEATFPTLCKMINNQIKAICVSLEAEVAISEVVRVPHRLNRARERRDRPPIADYHVIRLAHRHRVAPLPDDMNDHGDKRRSPRVHFVRGHWRHFQTHRTWIKWMLRGDPDLGFIDKHYRL